MFIRISKKARKELNDELHCDISNIIEVWIIYCQNLKDGERLSLVGGIKERGVKYFFKNKMSTLKEGRHVPQVGDGRAKKSGKMELQDYTPVYLKQHNTAKFVYSPLFDPVMPHPMFHNCQHRKGVCEKHEIRIETHFLLRLWQTAVLKHL